MLILEGGAVALAGVLVGRLLPGRRGRPKLSKPSPPPKPVCGCGHHRSYHGNGGACQQKVNRGLIEGWGSCGCKQYVGPEPLPEFFAPEIGV